MEYEEHIWGLQPRAGLALPGTVAGASARHRRLHARRHPLMLGGRWNQPTNQGPTFSSPRGPSEARRRGGRSDPPMICHIGRRTLRERISPACGRTQIGLNCTASMSQQSDPRLMSLRSVAGSTGCTRLSHGRPASPTSCNWR